MTGNVSLVENHPFLRLHAVISSENFETFGGHLKEAAVGATCEVFIIKSSKTVRKTLEDKIGLKLLDLES